MAWIYTLAASIGEPLLIWGLKSRQRLVMLGALLLSALITAFFLNRALLLQDSSSVYPVFVSLGAVASIFQGYFAYGEKLNRAQLVCIVMMMAGCVGLYAGAT